MNPIEKTFFMVWREGSAGFTKRHATRHDAQTEAARLARINPGVRFYVLQACSSTVVQTTIVTTLDGAPPESIPF